MNLSISKDDFDSYIPLTIALLGWLVLLGFLYYNYTQNNQDVFTLITTSGGNSHAQYTLLVLFSPLISSIIGYTVNRRLLLYKSKYLNEMRIKNLAENELVEIIDSLILSFVNALDAKSHWTKGHSLRVRDYSLLIARELGLSEGQLEQLSISALLHDIGKIGTYDDVLNKVEALTDAEFALIKKHPGNAVAILSPIKKFQVFLPCIKSHHERMDGRGYPDGLAGEEIPLLGRILCVADSYDAIVSARPYKETMTKEEGIKVIQRKAGTQFDPRVVAALTAVYTRPAFDAVEQAAAGEPANSSENIQEIQPEKSVFGDFVPVACPQATFACAEQTPPPP
jgi:putative nucleotidyltransferase with HDIG domain